jgi:hypothetical protein
MAVTPVSGTPQPPPASLLQNSRDNVFAGSQFFGQTEGGDAIGASKNNGLLEE